MRLLLLPTLLLLLLVFPTLARAQFVPDCPNCSRASWGEQWSPALNTCVYSPSSGCGESCNCAMGFWGGYGLSAKPEFFGGAFVRDANGVIQGFRIDVPGPLALNHVAAGDVAYLINGRKPRRSQFGTAKRPIRAAEATWDAQGRLRLRLLR